MGGRDAAVEQRRAATGPPEAACGVGKEPKAHLYCPGTGCGVGVLPKPSPTLLRA